MCIYCGTTEYRKIYEQHNGSIPKEQDGRTYDIHHIDGNRANNHPDNLVALTIQEHYNIHYTQSDWMACWKIGIKMKKSPKELSELSRTCQKARVENGTHNLMKRDDGTSLSSDRVKNGKHNLTKRTDGTSVSSDRVTFGTHHFLGEDLNRKRIENGKHNLTKRADGTSAASDRVAKGTHNFQKIGDRHLRYDHTIYELQHVDTSEIVSGTQQELGNALNLKDNISKLVNGQRKTARGWKLL